MNVFCSVLQALSLTTDVCETPSNWMPVTTIFALGPTDDYKGVDSRAICIKTLHRMKSPYRVIEFIEMQIHLGVSHFYIYKLGKTAPFVEPVIKYYESLGTLTQINWDLRLSDAFLPPEELEIVINNDCIYRSMNVHELVFIFDIDEYLIPRRPLVHTIKELLYSLHEHNNYHLQNVYSSYSFNKCLFCLKMLDNEQVCPGLFALKRRMRHMCLKVEIDNEWWQDVVELKAKQLETRRSIVHPKRVIKVGSHFVLEQVPGFKKEFKIPTYFASLNTYVEHGKDQWKCDISDTVAIDKYSQWLKPKINKVCSLLDLDEVL